MCLFQKLLPKLLLWIIWPCAISVLFQQNASAVSLPNNETVPAVIVFGDSLVDSGNNNYITTLIKCNFLPYGRDFAGGNQPTGRFSNGLIPSDIIAAKFGVKKILPAYLDPNLKLEDLLTGVSFASGGAGYDPLTSTLVSVIPLSSQLEMFKDYRNKIKEAVGGSRAADIISKSIYIVCIGSDDIANTYFQTPLRRAKYDIPSYTDLMAEQATSFLKVEVDQLINAKSISQVLVKLSIVAHAAITVLYGVGARRIGVFGLTALGCVPSLRTLDGGIRRACAESSNQAASLFNSKLSSQMSALNKEFPDARLVYLDSYNPLLDMIHNPGLYGFGETEKGCCGTGNIEVGILCNPHTLDMCANASSYIFWDSYHPTEKAYYVLSSLVLDNKIKNFF